MELLAATLTIIVGIIGYLLSRKDQEQASLIKDLYEKHEKDASKLQSLEVKIAENHYQKNEVDPKFERLESAIKDGLAMLGQKFDTLSAVLIKHVTEESKK